MTYIPAFRYFGLYEKSYRSYVPDHNLFVKFNREIKNWINKTSKNQPTETDVVNHINDLLKILNYNGYIHHNPQTQHVSSSHSDIEIIINKVTQVIIEVKKPFNTNELPLPTSIMSKALYECIWYYFNRANLLETYNIKHLVITDGTNYYFIKPASIAKLKDVETLCLNYKNHQLSLPSTNKLYSSIEDIINKKHYEPQIIWTYVSINNDREYIFKLLHRNFLLREYLPCDNNLLNNNFYKSLLEIIGLDQNKELLIQSDSKNSLIYGIRQSGLDLDNALQLASTWINRLLFLKLFEQQLVSFNGGDTSFLFLNQLENFGDYQNLFFNVLGTEYSSRGSFVNSYSKVPFLNSSLFEQIELEYRCSINYLDGLNLCINNTKLSEYIIQFLNKYNFVSNISTQNTDINPAILGLIFEKINGYSDGAVFTPAYITEYMTKDTIDKLVVNRFNEYFTSQGKEPCDDIDEVKTLLDSCIHKKNVKESAIKIFDTLRICDPAVGSGHFLVSALNYLLYLKFYLGLFNLQNIELDIQNDCLIVYEFKDGEYKQFKYNRNDQNSLNVQKTLFEEKSKIIRKNLFGVDINPTSVNICKLRLWIELLKNCYYVNQNDMEILPNLDINVLCGNSLISSFKYNISVAPNVNSVNLYGGLSTSIYMSNPNLLNQDLASYRDLVDKFWNARKKDYKNDIRKQIDTIKNRINPFDLFNTNYEQNQIFNNCINWGIDFPEVVESNTGNFLGFDAIITNPPYIRIQGLSDSVKGYYEEHYQVAKGNYELANLFVELVSKIVNKKSYTSFIMPHKFMNTANGSTLRDSLEKGILDGFTISKMVHFGANQIFSDVTTYTCIIAFDKLNNQKFKYQKIPFLKSVGSYDNKVKQITDKMYNKDLFSEISIAEIVNAYKLYGNQENNWILFNSDLEYKIFDKVMNNDNPTIKDISYKFMQGIATSSDDLYFLEMQRDNGTSFDFNLNYPKGIVNELKGIEKDYFKKVYKGKDVQRYTKLQTNRYVFFPYDLDKTTLPYKARIADLSYIQSICPNTHNYIMSNKAGFENRERGRFKGKYFYQLSRANSLGDFEQEKLMSMEITTGKTNFTLDTDNSYHNTKVYSLIKNNNYLYSYSFLLAVLNSSLFWWFLYNTGDTLSGDARTVKTNYIFPFHLPKYDINLDKLISSLVDKRMKGNEEIEKLIDLIVMKSYGLDFNEVKIINKSYETYGNMYEHINLGMSESEIDDIIKQFFS